MKERPILFSAPMVRALLDGSKTQTRRIVKLPHENALGQWEPTAIGGESGGRTTAGATIPAQGAIWHTRTGDCLASPYGQPGDRLWVREAWAQSGAWRIPAWPDADADDAYWSGTKDVIYTADAAKPTKGWRGRPSIHMPRWVSRILLEIVSVRVERLNDISESDADAEGCERLDSERYEQDWNLCDRCGGTRLHRELGPNGGVVEDVDCRECDAYTKRYKHLWESINGAGSWAANPWVWCIEFSRVAP